MKFLGYFATDYDRDLHTIVKTEPLFGGKQYYVINDSWWFPCDKYTEDEAKAAWMNR